MRKAVLLQPVFGRVSAGFNENGEGSVALPQSDKNIRKLRKTDVLPEIRTGSV